MKNINNQKIPCIRAIFWQNPRSQFADIQACGKYGWNYIEAAKHTAPSEKRFSFKAINNSA